MIEFLDLDSIGFGIDEFWVSDLKIGYICFRTFDFVA